MLGGGDQHVDHLRLEGAKELAAVRLDRFDELRFLRSRNPGRRYAQFVEDRHAESIVQLGECVGVQVALATLRPEVMNPVGGYDANIIDCGLLLNIQRITFKL